MFDIGSITKPFTTTAILTLASKGVLSVRDSLHGFFPGVPDDKRSITLHHLMTHTSGINEPPPDPHMIVRFGMVDDPTGSSDFLALASRPSLLDSVRAEFAPPVDQRRFLNGPVRVAASGENLGWAWAFRYDQWHMVDTGVELCDATPQYVHDHLAEWIASVGSYCPWSAFREGHGLGAVTSLTGELQAAARHASSTKRRRCVPRVICPSHGRR